MIGLNQDLNPCFAKGLDRDLDHIFEDFLNHWMCDRMLKARSTSAPTLYAFRTRIITIVLGQFAGGTFRRKGAKKKFSEGVYLS